MSDDRNFKRTFPLTIQPFELHFIYLDLIVTVIGMKKQLSIVSKARERLQQNKVLTFLVGFMVLVQTNWPALYVKDI